MNLDSLRVTQGVTLSGRIYDTVDHLLPRGNPVTRGANARHEDYSLMAPGKATQGISTEPCFSTTKDKVLVIWVTVEQDVCPRRET